jgi:preprotein translocase subunit SecG
MQKERAKGLGTALTGGGSANATFLDKNKGRTREGRLERYSKLLSVAFFILVIILGFLS